MVFFEYKFLEAGEVGWPGAVRKCNMGNNTVCIHGISATVRPNRKP